MYTKLANVSTSTWYLIHLQHEMIIPWRQQQKKNPKQSRFATQTWKRNQCDCFCFKASWSTSVHLQESAHTLINMGSAKVYYTLFFLLSFGELRIWHYRESCDFVSSLKFLKQRSWALPQILYRPYGHRDFWMARAKYSDTQETCRKMAGRRAVSQQVRFSSKPTAWTKLCGTALRMQWPCGGS